MNTEATGKVISIREEIAVRRGLEDRIADVFVTNPTSGALAELLREVDQTNTDAQAASKEAATRALDPKLRPAEVADARAKMVDADFRTKRMEAAADQLTTLLKETKAREEAEVRRKAREAAVADRDQLVKDIAAYEGHAAAIVELLRRIVANNAALGHSEPHAENIARGITNNPESWFPPLTEGVRLPALRRGEGCMGYVWPLRSY